MSDFDASDYRDIDGRLLTLFVAVLEEGSVTRAAVRLGVTQSAVSHLLDKLRGIVGDPLFVRSGRGIVATPAAHELAPRARRLLEDLAGFSRRRSFDAAQWQADITIAANDLQRDLLLPGLMARLREAAPGVRLRVLPSGVPDAALLRGGGCDLVITPRPPDSTEVLHRRLFEDRYRVFHDPARSDAPRDRADWLAREHLCVIHEAGRRMDVDEWFAARRLVRRVAVTLSGFGGLPAFLRSGPYVCTMPGLLGQGLLHGFASSACPVPTPRMPMYLCWHQRHHDDPAHRWLRDELMQRAQPWAQRAPDTSS